MRLHFNAILSFNSIRITITHHVQLHNNFDDLHLKSVTDFDTWYARTYQFLYKIIK